MVVAADVLRTGDLGRFLDPYRIEDASEWTREGACCSGPEHDLDQACTERETVACCLHIDQSHTYLVGVALVDMQDVVREVGDGLHARGGTDTISFVAPDGDDAVRHFVERRSLTPSSARRVIESQSALGLVVADIIDSAAIEHLQANHWSYWDRRGRLRLWLPEIGYRLDVPTRSFVSGADGPDRRHPVAGVGGLSLAVSLLTSGADVGVRSIARHASMSPSTISRARQHLVDASLVNPDGSPLVPELFWAASDSWMPSVASVDCEPEANGWVLAGDAAATHWGAPTLASRKRFYCTSQQSLSRFTHAHRSDTESPITVALAPTPLVASTAVDGVAHPAVAALDLSRTQRGREMLLDWRQITEHDGSVVGEAVWL